MSPDYSVIGRRIQNARLEQNLKQEELADKIGVSAGSINNIENAKTDTFNLKLLNDLSDALDIDLCLVLSKKHINQNYSINHIKINEDIANKYNELIYRDQSTT